MPTLEYAIESTHFLYMKTMTRTEARSFFNTVFYNWHKDATKILLNSRQFNEQVAKRANGANPQTLAE